MVVNHRWLLCKNWSKNSETDYTGPNGDLDTEAFYRAMLQYHNTSYQDTKLSPVVCIFGAILECIIIFFVYKVTIGGDDEIFN